MDNFNKECGEYLKGLRLTKGITQSKVAKEIGVTFQQVQKYEKGTNGLSLQKFCKFCNFMFSHKHIGRI